MMKLPNEIFGFPINNLSEEAKYFRSKHLCPFNNHIKLCDKQSRTITYPMGVCSVLYADNNIAICPKRFLEENIVFQNVCNEIFGTTNNIIPFSEIGLDNVGSFDFVLVKHKPLSSEIEDFCIVEFQTDSTTGTGKLVNALKDFVEGKKLHNNYAFGMNTYNTIKLSYIQMLIKGQVMEQWGKHIIWVMQKYVFENMRSRFLLENLEYNKNTYTKYFIYDLIAHDDIFKLTLLDKKSSTISNLLTAFTHQPLPSMKKFISNLQKKVELQLQLTVKNDSLLF